MLPEGFQTHRELVTLRVRVLGVTYHPRQRKPQGMVPSKGWRSAGDRPPCARLISRWSSPEGLEIRTGFMTLHLLHPHTAVCHTVKANCSAIGSHPMVTAASRFSNPEGLQTHRGSMALDLLHPHTPALITPLFDYITHPRNPLEHRVPSVLHGNPTLLWQTSPRAWSSANARNSFYNGIADLGPSMCIIGRSASGWSIQCRLSFM